MSIEEDFVIVNYEDVTDKFEFNEENEFKNSEHLNNPFVSKDEEIARELQAKFDKEYNGSLNKLEKLQNGTCKLNVSYEKYKKSNDFDESMYFDGFDEEDEYDYDVFDLSDDVDCDKYGNIDTKSKSGSFCRYLFNKNGNVITNHDFTSNGQSNMNKLMILPPNIQTGDGIDSLPMEISNNVLNGLKQHSLSKIHRENTLRKEKDDVKLCKLNKISKISLMGIDQSTVEIVLSLLKGMNPSLQCVKRKISEGKESWIYYGQQIPDKAYYYYNISPNYDCILKLYKLNFLNLWLYSNLEKHFLDDYRYKNRYNSKMSNFNKTCLWAERERDNLLRLKKYNIPSPEPILLKDNVLIMSFIGSKGKPAKKLTDVTLRKREYYKAYEQIVENMTIMYRKARLIHVDLSANNILWHKQKCYFIDLSHAVDISHPNAIEFLKNDCRYIIDFFDRKQIPDTMTKEQLFKHITGCGYDDKRRLDLLIADLKKKTEKTCKKIEKTKNCGRFEEFWGKSKPGLVGV